VGQEFLKEIFPIETNVNIFYSIVAPPDPCGPSFEQTSILNYIRKLSCKYELFWLLRRIFYNDSTYFCISMIISPWKRTWPSFSPKNDLFQI
jgi:hypothetical protein